MKPAQEARFWKKVQRFGGPNGDCWEWQGFVHPGGYGNTTVNHKLWMAHRLAYTLVKGEIPLGEILRHSCDNRKCVNPDHLTAGTQKQNMDDCVKRGRRNSPRGDAHGARKHRDKRPRGEYIPLSILNSKSVMEIRERYAAGGVRMDVLAKEYGVSEGCIQRVVSGITWAHLPVLPKPPRKGPNAKPRATHCANGHEYNEVNAYYSVDRRGYDSWTCKQCLKAKMRASYQPAAPRTQCCRGHELTEANTYRIGGRRRCRMCSALRQRGYRLKKEAQVEVPSAQKAAAEA